MALTTYQNLLDAVANWLARSDLTSYIPDFVVLFEADANLKLRTRQQVTNTSLTPSATGVAALPSDYGSIIRVTWAGTTNRQLEHQSPDIFYANYPDTTSGTPVAYTVEGSSLIVRPASSTSLTFVYKAKISALASGANWLFTNYPNAYLWGTLAEAGGFNIDADKMALWTQRRDAVFEDIKKLDLRHVGGMAIRPMGATP
jgi:hypothetical protein